MDYMVTRKQSQVGKENPGYDTGPSTPTDPASPSSVNKRKRPSPPSHRVIKLFRSAPIAHNGVSSVSDPESALSPPPDSNSWSGSVVPEQAFTHSTRMTHGQVVRVFPPVHTLNEPDHEILGRIEDCLGSHNVDTNGNQTADKPAAHDILQQLLDRDLVRVNLIISEDDAKLMKPIYEILAEREEMQGRNWRQQNPLPPNYALPIIPSYQQPTQLSSTQDHPVLKPRVTKKDTSQVNNVPQTVSPAVQLPPRGHFTVTTPVSNKKARSPKAKPAQKTHPASSSEPGDSNDFKPGMKFKLKFKVCT